MDNYFFKQNIEDTEIEYEIIPTSYFSEQENELDLLITENLAKIETLSKEIEELTVDADKWDYAISACSGVIAGLIDILFVGELSLSLNLTDASKIGEEDLKKVVLKVAKKCGFSGEDLSDADEFLEDNYKILADKATNEFGGGRQHHLRDFSHHASPVGLFCSLITQFTPENLIIGTDVHGAIKIVKLKDLKGWEQFTYLVGKDVPEKLTFGVINWILHMVSDCITSSGTMKNGGRGTGVPGPVISLVKELSALPIFKDVDKDGHKKVSVYISKLFNGTLLAEHDIDTGKIIKGTEKPFNLATEIGLAEQVGKNILEISKQFVPVIINECVVRSFYFIKRFVLQIKAQNIRTLKDLENLEWKKVLPYKNATLSRMLLVSVGVMEAIDLTEAAIAGGVEAAKHGVKGAVEGAAAGGVGAAAGAGTEGTIAFIKTFALHINYVGIGRFVIAVGSELSFDYKRNKKIDERIAVYNNVLNLENSKLLFRQADVWISAEETAKSIIEAYEMLEKYKVEFLNSMMEINDDLVSINEGVQKIGEDDKKDLSKSLQWGYLDMDENALVSVSQNIDVKQVPAEIQKMFVGLEELHTKIEIATKKAHDVQLVVYEKIAKKTSTKASIEGLQEASFRMAQAQIDAMNAQKTAFDFQRALSEMTRQLILMGTSNIAVNRVIVNEIQAKLDNYSEDNLGEAARRELENLLISLKAQQDADYKQRELAKIVKEHEEINKELSKNYVEMYNMMNNMQSELDNLREEMVKKNKIIEQLKIE